jgi:YVTN family beta-propeller protein
VVATIQVQSNPLGVAFTPDGTSAYVVNFDSNSVSVVDTASQTVVATVQVQSQPVGVAMALTSNGTFAYVTNNGSNTVSVIAAGGSPTVVQTINVGAGPHWVAVTPNSSLAYVENANNTVSVISVANNTVTATITVGTNPNGAAFTPDSSFAYVANSGSNTVSVIDTATSTVVTTVNGLQGPAQVALTADGTFAYVTNIGANNVSVIDTASNTITGTAGVGSAPIGVATASAPPSTQIITLLLSPTQPNVFNFGTNSFVVQYPAGTNFSNIDMTTAAVEITQASFQQRVAGTQFANATCIVYSGTGGNCVDYQVTCSSSGNPITCPGEPQPTIAVQTGFNTSQAIVNPGFLTTPIGQNQWQNIFTGFQDPTVKGKTTGFSEFVAVDLGATNPQGLANLKILYPQFPFTLHPGHSFPVGIQLTSVANGSPVTDAKASIAVTMVADGNGNPTQQTVLSATNVFKRDTPGVYVYSVHAVKYPAGTYNVTIYGNAFAAFEGQFKIVK